MPLLILLLIWAAVSVPVALIAGRLLRGCGRDLADEVEAYLRQLARGGVGRARPALGGALLAAMLVAGAVGAAEVVERLPDSLVHAGPDGRLSLQFSDEERRGSGDHGDPRAEDREVWVTQPEGSGARAHSRAARRQASAQAADDRVEAADRRGGRSAPAAPVVDGLLAAAGDVIEFEPERGQAAGHAGPARAGREGEGEGERERPAPVAVPERAAPSAPPAASPAGPPAAASAGATAGEVAPRNSRPGSLSELEPADAVPTGDGDGDGDGDGEVSVLPARRGLPDAVPAHAAAHHRAAVVLGPPGRR